MRFVRLFHGPVLLALGLAAIPCGVWAAPSSGQGNNGSRDVTVMTRNLYLGASLQDVIGAEGAEELLFAVKAVRDAVDATDFNERAESIADEIEDTDPDLIGLQEAALWRIQSPGDLIIGGTQPATEVLYDFVEILLDELDDRGLSYDVVVSIDQLDAELPAFNFDDLPNIGFDDLRLTDRDVILARTDLPHGHLQILDTDSGQFDSQVEFIIGGQPLSIPRGWVSADVKVRGKAFRFVNAHLEDGFPEVQEPQAEELVAGPLDVDMPVICLGDFNSDAFGEGTESYEIILDAGFEDAWLDAAPLDPGLTWGHDPELVDPDAEFSERLDLVLYRGSFTVGEFDIYGEELADMTSSGLWPSDHGGVVGTFTIKGSFK